MKSIYQYFAGMFKGIWSLLVGMSVTTSYLFRPWTIVVQQYPENRKGGRGRSHKKLEMFDRFKGELIMPHNEANEHKCTACGICEINCPNGTITVISDQELVDGKKKRFLDKHIYRLGMCSFCGLCVKTCPSKALSFIPTFEHSVFDRTKLTKVLNMPDSKLMKGVE